jgi:hypothetical protein
MKLLCSGYWYIGLLVLCCYWLVTLVWGCWVVVSGMLSGSGIWLAGMIELGHVLPLPIFGYCLGTPDLVALGSDTALVDFA